MNYRMIINLIGKILKVEAALMLIPMIISIVNNDSAKMGFIIAVLLLAGIGFGISFIKPKNKTIYTREGFVIVALSWIIMSLFGALPFFISRAVPNYIDALYETVSGFTTTGATILTDIEALPRSLLFWRSFTHWIGGMGVLVFTLAIIPKSDAQSMYVMKAEVPGPKVGKLVSKTMITARILYAIYIALSLLEMIFLLCGGMPLFDSIVNTFSTAGTGGFSILNSSIGGYGSLYSEMVIMVFMVLFGMNFSLFYLLLIRQVKQVFKNEELRYYLLVIVGSIIFIALNIMSIYNNFWESLRYSGFQVASIITTTGFATANYASWPAFSQILLTFLMVLGASSGSTSGGVKVSRVIILIKSGLREVKKVFNPRTVMTINVDGKPVEEEVVKGVSIFFAIHIMIAAISCIFLSLDPSGLEFSEILSSVISNINNVGPMLGEIGLAGNFSVLSEFSKLVLSVDMLVGRLEIFPVLMLFMPSTWKRI